MNVCQLIAVLGTMPPDAEVRQMWEGAARSVIDHVWLSREGYVVTAEGGEISYDSGDRPIDAPSVEQDRTWRFSPLAEAVAEAMRK